MKMVNVIIIFYSSATFLGLSSKSYSQTNIKPVQFPEIITSPIMNVTSKSSVASGEVTSDGGSAVSARGICIGTSVNPTIQGTVILSGSGPGRFSVDVKNLVEDTKYFIRVFATNKRGTVYGDQLVFATMKFSPVVPTVNLLSPAFITSRDIFLKASISTAGEDIDIVERGFCYASFPSPTINERKIAKNMGRGYFKTIMQGLPPTTTFYIRAYATSGTGTVYSDEKIFTTGGSVSDIDGNVYPTVKIGEQIWMAENLKTSRYQNGDPILTNLSEKDWKNSGKGAFVYYDDDTSNNNLFGKLYNWYAVMDKRKICPVGWHIPADTEVRTLMNFLKKNNYTHKSLLYNKTWSVNDLNNAESFNLTGFSALAAGKKDYYTYRYSSKYEAAYFWTTTIDLVGRITLFYLVYPEDDTELVAFGINAYSCRCLRN
jgi:uncharacterized protein (TIGR02145 family)